VPGLVSMTPAAVGINPATEGVHAGVQVRADSHPVHPGVVTDVDHGGQLVATAFRTGESVGELALPEQLLDPKQEARAADAADENGDLHTEGE
jgi:hypothetical protein